MYIVRSRQVKVYTTDSETIWKQFTNNKEHCKCCPTSLIFIPSSSMFFFSFESLKLSRTVSVLVNCQLSKITVCVVNSQKSKVAQLLCHLQSHRSELDCWKATQSSSKSQGYNFGWLTSAVRNHFSLVERKHAISSPFKTDIKEEKAEGLVESCAGGPSSRNWLWQLRVASIIR